jgi:uncharacterized protein
MEYFVICLVAFLGSLLTLFSGFGLGTLLVPVFALFFPIEIAISLTAIVHLLNNLFKFSLLGKNASKGIVFRFGIPSIIAAFAGAYMLIFLSSYAPLFHYSIGSKTFYIMPVELTVAALLIFFALFEVIPALTKLEFNKEYMILGGLLSGFFGGLSGNQGALRTAFLARIGLSKESFIATGVAIACLIDVSRLIVYSGGIFKVQDELDFGIVAAATFSAFAGAYTGTRLLKKVTIKALQYFIAIMLVLYAILLGLGIA